MPRVQRQNASDGAAHGSMARPLVRRRLLPTDRSGHVIYSKATYVRLLEKSEGEEG